jgi:hypothetical protein
MLSAEEYAAIVTAASNNEPVSAEQVDGLIKTVQHMDLQLVIGQNALQLAMENLETCIPAIAEKVMERCGRTDMKTKKAIAQMAGELVGQCEESVQNYVVGAMVEASRLLDIPLEELLGTEHLDQEDNQPEQD